MVCVRFKMPCFWIGWSSVALKARKTDTTYGISWIVIYATIFELIIITINKRSSSRISISSSRWHAHGLQGYTLHLFLLLPLSRSPTYTCCIPTSVLTPTLTTCLHLLLLHRLKVRTRTRTHNTPVLTPTLITVTNLHLLYPHTCSYSYPDHLLTPVITPQT